MKKFFLSLIAGALCLTASAQTEEYVEYPHAFIGVQGGVQTIKLRENNDKTVFTPAGALSLGTMVTPQWGARLNFEGVWDKISGKSFGNYKYQTFTGDLDVLFNLSNALRSDKYKPFNFYLLAGAGLIGNVDVPGDNVEAASLAKDWWNLRAGFIADYRISKITSVNLEVNGNYMGGSQSDLYGDGKWKVNAFLGLAFKIPFNMISKAEALRAKQQAELETIARQEAEAERARAEAAQAQAARAAAAAKAKAEAAKKLAEEQATAARMAAEEAAKKLNETIFFTIGKTATAEDFNDVVEKTAEWCKKFPDKTATIDAYADKGTGTAKQNRIVAKRRATAVANAIKAKGISADQLAVASHGDKVQPFAENDQNRCVIIVGK